MAKRHRALINFCDKMGWECHLCGRAIPEEFELHAPMAPSKDHVVPKTKLKGEYRDNNILPAHRWCNSHRQHHDPAKLPPGYFDGLEAAQEKFMGDDGVLV